MEMRRVTKQCRIAVLLNSGLRVEGDFHNPADGSAATRPFDAIRDMKSGLLLLTSVQVTGPDGPRRCNTVLISREVIAMIELPEGGWAPPGTQAG